MCGYEQDQVDELQVLQAIYPSEITVISDTPPIKFQVCLKANSENNEDHTLTLNFEIVEKYPEVGPLIEIEELGEGLNESDRIELDELLEKEIANNLGMVMVFALLSTVNEWLQQKCENFEQRKIEEQERRKKEVEEAELRRFEGTRVTIETFMAWKRKFDTEMAELERQKQKDDGINKKLTGRELFEKDKTMIESDLKFLTEDDDVCLDTDDVKVDESLFQALDDVDLNDLSDNDCK